MSRWIVLGLFILQVFVSAEVFASCRFPKNDDLLAHLLNIARECPKNVFELRALLEKSNLKIETTMVANRGFHNPAAGSFSFFENVNGDELFFGHFTAVNDENKIAANQDVSQGNLMIEAFAWDATKGYYNFYELIGQGDSSQWFYRGDSADILADNASLHLQQNPDKPVFGERLRCSGCHMAGGPIMKELTFPFNDWWTPQRKLDFGGRGFAPELLPLMANLASPERLAKSVQAGLNRLEQSGNFSSVKMSRSLPEILRPLFCPMELNFESDLLPNDLGQNVSIPSAFFIDPRLTSESTRRFSMARGSYNDGLAKLKSAFPETARVDSDRAWLTPVKAYSDILAVEYLVRNGVVTDHFVRSILSVDFTNPVFSKKRCELLRKVPKQASPGWMEKFLMDTQQAPQIEQYLGFCAQNLAEDRATMDYLTILTQRRAEAAHSEISANKLGQILEPGFRVIFPKTTPPAKPWAFRLNDRGILIDQK